MGTSVLMEFKKEKFITGLICLCILSTLWIAQVRFSFQFQVLEITSTRIPPTPAPPPPVPEEQSDYIKFKQALSLENSIKRTSNCPTYFESLKSVIFQSNFKGPVEFTFPPEESVPAKLAYSYVAHDYPGPGQFEILLHSTFRPYNSYCIYLDYRANKTITEAFHNLIDCYKHHFPDTTIFMYPHPAEVYWAHYSLLNADLRCLEGLYLSDDKWDYYVNLAGSELPVESVETLAERLTQAKINILVESVIVNTTNWRERSWLFRWKNALETISR